MMIVQPPKRNVQMITGAKGCSIYHQQQNERAIETEVNAPDMLIQTKTRLMNDSVLVYPNSIFSSALVDVFHLLFA